MTEHNPITKLTSGDESFDLGATFNHVYISDDNDFSLEDFYNHMKDFLTNSSFIVYSENEPAVENENVKVWYDTTPTTIQ